MNNFNIKEHFFNPSGRFSRETFTVSYVGLYLTFFLIGFLLGFSNILSSFFLDPFLTAIGGIFLYAMCVVCIKRVHDLNLSGWYGVFIALTPLHIFLLPYLISKKGTPVENDYGEPQRYKSKPLFLYGSYAFCFLCMVLLIIVILGAVAFPAYNKFRSNALQAVFGATGATGTYVVRAFQACISVNPFTSCDEISELGINLDGYNSNEGKSAPNFCVDLKSEIGRETETLKACYSINATTSLVTSTFNKNVCFGDVGGNTCAIADIADSTICVTAVPTTKCTTDSDCTSAGIDTICNTTGTISTCNSVGTCS